MRFRRVALVASFQAESTGSHRHGLRDRARARGPDPRYRPPPRGDPRLHRAGQTALPDPPSHPLPGFGGAGCDDRGTRDHAVPPVGGAAQRMLRGSQGQPPRSSAPGLRRLDHRAAPRADADPCRNPCCRRRSRAMEASPRWCHWPAGHAPRCGTTSPLGASIITRSTTGATRRSVAPRALVQPRRARASGPGAGGGKGTPTRSACSIRPSRAVRRRICSEVPVSAPIGRSALNFAAMSTEIASRVSLTRRVSSAGVITPLSTPSASPARTSARASASTLAAWVPAI